MNTATQVDFVGPKNAPFTNVVGHLSLSTPLVADDIATKGYVDNIASSASATEGTFAYTFTGSASDPIIMSMHYYKIGNVVVLTCVDRLTFGGNDAPLTAVDTTPSVIQVAGGNYPAAILTCSESVADVRTVAILSHGDGEVSIHVNGTQNFEAAKTYTIAYPTIRYALVV